MSAFSLPPHQSKRVLVAFLDDDDSPMWSEILSLQSFELSRELNDPPYLEMRFYASPLEPR